MLLSLENGTKQKKKKAYANLCDLNEVEDEFHFVLQYPNCQVLRKELIVNFISAENINLTGNRLGKLNLLFAKETGGSLNALGKTYTRVIQKTGTKSNTIIRALINIRKNKKI